MALPKIALFGGGPACLMAAFQLSKNYQVTLYEQGKRIGRKFLVAGNGGFNLTNSLQGEDLKAVYSADALIQNALNEFGSQDVREWLEELGIATFIGSSGRVFPEKGIKPADVLSALKKSLLKQKVDFKLNAKFIGFSKSNKPIVAFEDGHQETIEADYYFFGLGGGSWTKTGSNDLWFSHFRQLGIKVLPFQPSNCGLNVSYPTPFQEKFAGTPLKNISCKMGSLQIKGEALISDYGMEGNAIYPLISEYHRIIEAGIEPQLVIDFKPQNTVEELIEKAKGKNLLPKNYGHHFNLPKAVIQLIKLYTNKRTYLDVSAFAKSIKNLIIPIDGLRPIDEAISTVGGIDLAAVNLNFSLKKHPNIFVLGEMLNWDAPTGGFLLQGCFSTGAVAAKSIKK